MLNLSMDLMGITHLINGFNDHIYQKPLYQSHLKKKLHSELELDYCQQKNSYLIHIWIKGTTRFKFSAYFLYHLYLFLILKYTSKTKKICSHNSGDWMLIWLQIKSFNSKFVIYIYNSSN